MAAMIFAGVESPKCAGLVWVFPQRAPWILAGWGQQLCAGSRDRRNT
jgi:hypothetical protein